MASLEKKKDVPNISIFWGSLLVLVPLRVLGGVVNGISDCDEVYNYWEAAFLIAQKNDDEHRCGFQTWEYAFGLRSWAFVVPFGLGARLLGFVGTRIFFLALPSAVAEASLVSAVHRAYSSGLETLIFFVASPGLFVSSASLLPSSVCLTLIFCHESSRIRGEWQKATVFAVIATLWPGWPFVGVYFLPFLVRTLLNEKFFDILAIGIQAGFLTLLPVLCIDATFYGALTLPLLKVFLYNAAQNDDLYGVEPLSFYLKNLLLNVSLMPLTFLLATPFFLLATPFILQKDLLWCALPSFLWLLVLCSRPHKEERFTYPAFASLLVSAGLCARRLLPRRLLPKRRFYLFILAALSVGSGSSRLLALHTYYWRPQLETWRAVAEFASKEPKNVTVCVGKEWYRFPSTFFLPPNARLAFVDDGFDGILPRHWDRSSNDRFNDRFLGSALAAASRNVTAHFNDQNRRTPDRYVQTQQCDFLVDLLLSDQAPTWQRRHRSPFLDAAQTPQLARALFLPFHSTKRVYADYVLLQNPALAPKKPTTHTASFAGGEQEL